MSCLMCVTMSTILKSSLCSLTEHSTSLVGETNTTLMEKSHTAEIYKRRGRPASSQASPSIPQRNGQPCSISGSSATAKVVWAVLTISHSPTIQALVLISQHRQPHSVCTIISDSLSRNKKYKKRMTAQVILFFFVPFIIEKNHQTGKLITLSLLPATRPKPFCTLEYTPAGSL